jgi:membrane-associated phospholipid phosphatase
MNSKKTIAILRSFPCIFPIITLLYGLILKSKILLYYGFISILVNLISHKLKYYTKLIYESLNINKLFILGIGKRPRGAVNCGCFIDENNPIKLCESYGMPSGHSIIAILTATFWTIYILNNSKNNLFKILSILILNSFCVLVCFSRIYLNCHTIQQVIIGAIIGFIFGKISYKYYINNIKYL